ncbi:hypothetical protein [Parafrankia soli]|uniref:hypothetical protein n=1 Tax=Parafrankia soli TaxID=2599596 RepID=UPI0012FF919F|nr:hypothetical protein [Parafrankia soli]
MPGKRKRKRAKRRGAPSVRAGRETGRTYQRIAAERRNRLRRRDIDNDTEA